MLTYILLFMILVIEMFLIFHEKFENVLYGAMAITINLMCFRGIVSSLYAIITGHTFLEIYT
ncbi:MAG: hypothetical protein GX025_07875, partial [Clostridiales bacterium]|nr:hypothetical protein [Clostridiales bacterium]